MARLSAPLPKGAVHLLAADDSLAEQHAYRGYLALCGTLVPAWGLPASLCPDECARDHPYCPQCLRAAARCNAEADCASGVVTCEDGSWSVHVR